MLLWSICIPESSKLDNVISDDSLLLSAKKMTPKKGLTWQQELEEHRYLYVWNRR